MGADVPLAAARDVRAALEAAGLVILLRGILDDAASASILELLSALAAEPPDARALADAYVAAFRRLAAVADQEPVRGLDDAWQAHLTALLLDDVNPWSVQAERVGSEGVAPGLRAQAGRDLRALRLLFELDAARLLALARAVREDAAGTAAWGAWTELASPLADDSGNSARTALRRQLADCADWPALLGDLERHWSRHGTGIVARFRVLRWDGGGKCLQGIAHPDPIALAQLVAYEREQAALTANVERFLRGLPAHHALLYGAPGTGKSSTVKAIANAYADRGLRLVEVRKDDLEDLPAITAQVRGRAPRFLLFVDDLSFEEQETEYKALKALLEGAAEARPENLLIYATTNRRNLIRESFADRGVPSDDVHGRDSMQEKISLAARFGLRVTFAAPDQPRYLAIATALARGRGLAIDEEELRARALTWERQHVGRSGRTARQFVDDLEAELRGAAGA